jgi:hypothetical protein
MNVSNTRSDAIVSDEVGHEFVLYDPEAREAWVLNLTARFVCALCDAGRSIPEIAQAILESFDQVSFDTAKGDVEDLLQAHPRLRYLNNPGDRLSEPAQTSGEKPRYMKPAVQRIAQEQFIKQSHGLGDSINPMHFGDSWEGCGGDAET